MTYCIRNAVFSDFRWTYTMRTLHNSECSVSSRYWLSRVALTDASFCSLLNDDCLAAATAACLPSSYWFWCRALQLGQRGHWPYGDSLTWHFLICLTCSLSLQIADWMLGSGFDTFYCRFLASFMIGLLSTITRKCIHFAITTTFRHQALPAVCTRY